MTKKLSEFQIRKAFNVNKINLTEELLSFEKNYSGLIVSVGYVKIEFGIIQGGGFPFVPELSIIEFEENNINNARFLIKCARSEYPMNFALDEKGRYYEDFELKFESFEDMIKEIKSS